MSYAEFKAKVLSTIDGVLAKHRPIPNTVMDQVSDTVGLGKRVTTNVIGETTTHEHPSLVHGMVKYNKCIDALLGTRKLVADRTTFGWFLMTRRVILLVVGWEIDELCAHGKLVLSSLRVRHYGMQLNRRRFQSNLLIQISSPEEIVAENVLAELKTYIHTD